MTPNKNNTESTHLGEDRIVPYESIDFVTDAARTEIAVLKQNGLDVELVEANLNGHYRLDNDKQRLVTRAIKMYSAIPNFVDHLSAASPAVAAWHDMAQSKSPLALSIFYDMGNMDRPSDGLSKDAILHTPLPIESGKTATEMTKVWLTAENANEVLRRVENFFRAGSLKDGVDQFGLTAHDIMAGSLDRIGDITRANVAIDMGTEHILAHPERFKERGVVSVSLACGAAEPVYWLMKRLQEQGIPIEALHLVDMDPIALAASADRSKHYQLDDKIVMHNKNLFREQLDTYIESGSADIVDIIGLIEYLEPKAAVAILKRAKKIVRPGGMIVFGNMHSSRPEQAWFDGLWPELKQRSITEMIEIITDAGFPAEWLKVRLSKDGLYPMYGIEVPEDAVLSDEPAIRRLGRTAALQKAA